MLKCSFETCCQKVSLEQNSVRTTVRSKEKLFKFSLVVADTAAVEDLETTTLWSSLQQPRQNTFEFDDTNNIQVEYKTESLAGLKYKSLSL